jgi:transposase-like protein
VAYVDREIGVLVRARPAEATQRIVAALVAARGSVPGAAKTLGVSRASLDRWLPQLGLKHEVRRLLEARLPLERGKRRLSVMRALARCGKLRTNGGEKKKIPHLAKT